MIELYWLTRLDNINILLCFTLAICLGLTLIFFIRYCAANTDGDPEDFQKSLLKNAKRFGIIAIFAAVIDVFVPTTKEAYLIYGVGGTIDYIKSNKTARQIPDKVINAIDKYIDTFTEKSKKE
jgi:hypothetical protein